MDNKNSSNTQIVNTQKTKIASYWSKWALVWDPMLRLTRLNQRYRKEAISVLNLEKSQTVLDVACGTGLNFRYLFNGIGPDGRIIATDIAPGMLDKAKIRAQNNGFNNIEFILGDVSEIELLEVDAVAAFWCMVSILDYKMALRNLVSNLRSGGKLAVLDFKKIDGFPGIFLKPISEKIFQFTHQDIDREPWLYIGQLLTDVKMHEWKLGGILGNAYLAWGEKE